MSLKDALLYTLSLPERLLRSTSAAVGGASKLMTDSLLPRSVRGMGFYKYFVGNTQKFLIESLGEVKTAGPEKLPDDYLPRKIVGNVADAAGIFAFHFSPLWFFALVGDAAAGSKEVLQRVVAELKKDGSLPPDASIGSVESLLDALSHASATSAAPIDAPPLSKKDVAALADQVGTAYSKLYASTKAALPSPEQIWDGLLEISRREKLPLLKVSGALTLAAAKAAGKTTGDLFYEKVLLSYSDSLSEVRAKGFGPFFAEAAAPYLDAVSSAFSLQKKTFIERWLSR